MIPSTDRSIRWLLVGAKALFMTSWLIRYWPVWVVLVSLVSPISPHLRLSPPLAGTTCTYIGVRGFMWERLEGTCSLIALIDTRGRSQW